MNKKNLTTRIYEEMRDYLAAMQEHPEMVTEEDTQRLNDLYSQLCKTMGISEHSQWRVEWQLDKWLCTADKEAGKVPDETLYDSQNIVLDLGATEMLNLIAGVGGTAYNSANAYIYVGTDTTPENASQSGVLATGSNRAFAAMDTGYPVVNGRQMIYRASFGDTSANFAWNEASIVNGTGANAIAMNRKVSSMGTKNSGTWTLQITVSLTSTT